MSLSIILAVWSISKKGKKGVGGFSRGNRRFFGAFHSDMHMQEVFLPYLQSAMEGWT